MGQAQINLRIDEMTKREAEAVFDAIGLSMATAITVFLKTVAREQRIPFELTVEPFNRLRLKERLNKMETDLNVNTAKLTAPDLMDPASAVEALRKAQAAFAGVAEAIGVFNEEDVQAIVDEARYGKKK